MCRVQAKVFDRDIRVYGLKFPEGNNGADAVVPSGIQETDMQGQVNANLCIMETEHIKSMPEIEGFFVAVPSPVCVGVGEMAFAGTMGGAVFHAFADLMPIRGSVGMDTGAITGKSEAIGRDEPVAPGREDSGQAVRLVNPSISIRMRERMI